MRHHDKEIVERAEAISYFEWNQLIKNRELFLKLVNQAIENESDEPMIFFESLITLVEKELGKERRSAIQEFFSHDPIRDALEAHFPGLELTSLKK
tara:strand:- start:2571 stop:2858 length:288 start_codon:yes stop_codon:yes gene_type:complete